MEATALSKSLEPEGLGKFRFQWRADCAAPPDTVYGTIANLRSALIWTGEQMPKSFRVTSMDAPSGEATQGTEWASEGLDPSGKWDDRSIVIRADPPRQFVYRTSSVFTWKGGKRSTAEIKHVWDIAPQSSGSTVTYVFLGTGVQPMKAPWNVFFATPGLRQLGMAMIKSRAGKAFANLIRLAESRSSRTETDRVA
jgi:hypothetical protein